MANFDQAGWKEQCQPCVRLPSELRACMKRNNSNHNRTTPTNCFVDLTLSKNTVKGALIPWKEVARCRGWVGVVTLVTRRCQGGGRSRRRRKLLGRCKWCLLWWRRCRWRSGELGKGSSREVSGRTYGQGSAPLWLLSEAGSAGGGRQNINRCLFSSVTDLPHYTSVTSAKPNIDVKSDNLAQTIPSLALESNCKQMSPLLRLTLVSSFSPWTERMNGETWPNVSCLVVIGHLGVWIWPWSRFILSGALASNPTGKCDGRAGSCYHLGQACRLALKIFRGVCRTKTCFG